MEIVLQKQLEMQEIKVLRD